MFFDKRIYVPFKPLSTFFALFLLLMSTAASADPRIMGTVDIRVFKQAQALLAIPESEIDFIDAKLAIDKMIDSQINIFREKNRLLRMAGEIRAMGDLRTSSERKEALRKYLYGAGEWNNNRVFSYDFDDPLGKKIENKLLKTYLDTRKGNCVSMPFLFIALGQELGLDVTAANAPLHVFVKYKDAETGKIYNLETTSGANVARSSWLRQQFSISDKSIASGIYLRKLTKKQTVLTMFDTVLEHYADKGEYALVAALAGLQLNHNPNHVNAFVHLASAHNDLLQKYGLWKYHSSAEVPANQRHIFDYLVPRINWYHQKAIELGWQPSTPETDSKYLETVANEAAKLNGD